MKLLSLSVEHFRCVRKSRVEFGGGLNVLHGPNDLGKSTLAAAIRAALLMQTSSKEAEEFINWYGSGDPYVELVFESEPQRIWRIRKTFGNHPQAFLEESRDGVDFHVEARAREVDGRLSEILRWGLAPPGGKGRPKGMPVTFLSTALLAEQDEVAAIFNKALSGDSDESGKKRLIEALQAAAEDPLFKSVLHIVQARVDEAFASSGQRRRGKDSPWIKLREQIQRAEEDERQCSEQLQKTTSIESELQELLNQRLECDAVLGKAMESLKCAEDEYLQISQRTEILARLRAAQSRVDEITSAIRKFSDAKARHLELSQIGAQLVDSGKEARLSLAARARDVETAKEAVRVRSVDQAQERQLKKNTLEKNRAELLSEQVRNSSALNQVRAIESIVERTRTIETTADGLTKKIGELTIQHAEAVKALRDLDEQENALVGVAQLIRGNLAKAGIAEAEKALAQIETWQDQARRHRDQAIAMENMLDGITLPAAANLDALKRLEHQLQIARAAVGVGIHLRVRPKRELHLSIRRDEGELERSVVKDGLFEATAKGEIRLDIGDVAEISVSGGEDSAREEVARLQVRWIAEAEPVLKQAGLANLDDVVLTAKKHAANLEQIRDLRQAAAALDQRLSDQRDWVSLRAERQRELVASEEALAGKDRKELETVALKLGANDPAAVEAGLGKLRAQRPKMIERERYLEGEQKTASALSTEKQRDLLAIREELLSAQSAVEGYSEGLLTQLQDEQSRLADRLKETERQLQSLDADTDSTLVELRGVLGIAENEHRAADVRHRAIAEELRKSEGERATVEGELKVLGEVAEKLDESAAVQDASAIEAELARAPKPDRDVTEEMLADARAAAKTAQDELRDIEDAIQSKRGALQHVGGHVAKERAEDAREALTLLREQERNLEIDYDAWALLRETLLEAEQEEGVHLGRVLGDPIVQRFADLTDGRYGKLALGPDLETDTISVAGEGRSVGALSIGTRDQLSIIFRLTLAEQLQSAVVLDDQLTQSDAQRMVWLRNLIKQMAARIQILVFTCRPTDYLVPSELKAAKKSDHFNTSVRSVDLTQAIERSGPPPALK
jgi:DNA repair exonuclease SbcCD ATPase subunit